MAKVAIDDPIAVFRSWRRTFQK